MLKSWETTKINLKLERFSDEEIEAIKIYFDKATSILRTYQFKNKTEKRVWEMYSEGSFEREISRDLKLTRYEVCRIVGKIKKAHGLP